MKKIVKFLDDSVKLVFDTVKDIIVGFLVLVDESRMINEDGSWDGYNRRRNEKKMRRSKR